MHDQPKVEPLEASTFFADGTSARPLVAGTVARGDLREERSFYTGLDAEGQFVTALPVSLSHSLLERGRSRYDSFCSPCHGRRGDGLGMIVRRGFKRPTSFHDPRLRDSPVGYFFYVAANGFGQMSSYAAQIGPQDRWAVAAYIRALQLSRHAPAEELPAADRARLEASPTAAGAAAREEEHGK